MYELRPLLERARRLAPPPADDSFERLVRRRARKARSARIGSAAVALVLAAAAVGGAVFALREHRPPAHVPVRPAAEPTLPTIGPGQYDYEKRLFIFGTSTVDPSRPSHPYVAYYTTVRLDYWIAPDGSGRLRDDQSDASFGPGQFPRLDLIGDVSSLSTDPHMLEQQLIERSAPGGASPEPEVSPGPGQGPQTGVLWRAISDLLFQAPQTTPRLRAALFEVAAGLPTATVDPNSTDPGGRSATKLTLVTEGTVHELWVDPYTLQPMALRDTVADTHELSALSFVEVAGVTDSTADEVQFVDRLVPPAVTEPSPPPVGKKG